MGKPFFWHKAAERVQPALARAWKTFRRIAATPGAIAQQHVRFKAALDNMGEGLCMFDAEKRLVVCNQRYAGMYQLPEALLKPGTPHSEIIAHRVRHGILRGDKGGGAVEQKITALGQLPADAPSSRTDELADGRLICVTRQPMTGGGWVATHNDVTERQLLQARIEQQNQRFDAALKNMSHGLCMYDAEQRLVIANDRYAAMYNLTAEQVAPGTTLRQILEHRIAAGAYGGNTPEDYIDERLAAVREGKASTKVQTLSDGRVIAISHQPMADGGWVATHQDMTEQRRSDAKIAHMALHDALTDLPNRALLKEHLERAVTRTQRGEVVAIHLLDLDHFKNVNDTLGHPTGDQLLIAVGNRLRTLVRGSDTIARMGGDEFAIVQVDLGEPADAAVLAQRIIEAISAPYDIEGHHVVVAASVGITTGPTDGNDADQLIRNADLALYRAKAEGRGVYRFFEPEMDARMKRRRTMEYDLRRALVSGEFELHYQPLINLEHNEITGCEALVRWLHPEKGLVSPGEFIPLAEENGFIVPLGEWIIRQACVTAARWPDHIRVAVNISPAQFKNKGLMQVVVGALAMSALPPQRLELEITEAILLDDSADTLAILHQLRALGVRIAMDDFGTGYSSLSYLQSFPFDKIKIDRSFIKEVADGKNAVNIVRAIAALANGLGMETTAEGVETQDQLDAIRSQGCTEMQGFFFSRARPAHEIESLLRSNSEAGTLSKTATAA